jgi:hypothetical protein
MISRRGLLARVALALASIIAALGSADQVEVAEARRRRRRRRNGTNPY